MRTFLLERSRVTSTSKALERSYHVMYELCCGSTPHTHGKTPDFFNYLSMSGQLDCPGRVDADEFKITSAGRKSAVAAGARTNPQARRKREGGALPASLSRPPHSSPRACTVTGGCGFAADELDQMWAFLAGMLYLGNIQFGSGDKVPPDLWNGTEPDAPGWCPRRA